MLSTTPTVQAAESVLAGPLVLEDHGDPGTTTFFGVASDSRNGLLFLENPAAGSAADRYRWSDASALLADLNALEVYVIPADGRTGSITRVGEPGYCLGTFASADTGLAWSKVDHYCPAWENHGNGQITMVSNTGETSLVAMDEPTAFRVRTDLMIEVMP